MQASVVKLSSCHVIAAALDMFGEQGMAAAFRPLSSSDRQGTMVANTNSGAVGLGLFHRVGLVRGANGRTLGRPSLPSNPRATSPLSGGRTEAPPAEGGQNSGGMAPRAHIPAGVPTIISPFVSYYYPTSAPFPDAVPTIELTEKEKNERYGFLAMECKKNDVSKLSPRVPFKHELDSFKTFCQNPLQLDRPTKSVSDVTFEDNVKMISKFFGYLSKYKQVSECMLA